MSGVERSEGQQQHVALSFRLEPRLQVVIHKKFSQTSSHRMSDLRIYFFIDIGLKITRSPEFRGYRMHSIFIKNHICSRRRDMCLDHELLYNNVVGSFIGAAMVEEILLIQCRQKS